MTTPTDPIEYAPVSESQRAAALAMLVSTEPASEWPGRIATIVTALRSGDNSTKTLLGATRGDQLVAVAWGQILPGKTVLLWPPRLSQDASEAVGDQLQRCLDGELKAAGMRMAQAVLTDVAHPDAQRLLRVGYEHAADLLYLICPLKQRDAAVARLDVDFVPYGEAKRSRLAAVVERTYVSTLDVPALDGIRDMDDILRGYEHTGEFSPDRWFFIQHRGQDIGCLLLNDHPGQQQWELVYLGIVPEARGNGWGEQAARFAQSFARDAGREQLILAVDAKNDPAVSAYTKAGFFEILRQAVMLKIFAA